MFTDPPPTQYDIHFSIFGIPVRVHPLFWAVAVMLGLSLRNMTNVLLWMVALFLAILVHELGHALVMRYYGLRPWITLHGFGGLAAYDSSQLGYSRANTWIRQIFISAAGAGAGFLLALILIGICLILGYKVMVIAGIDTGYITIFGIKSGLLTLSDPTESYTGLNVAIWGIQSEKISIFIYFLLRVCIIWGLVNLLPVYPLDGGQIWREILLRFNAREGIRRSLILSTVTATLLAAFFLFNVLRDVRSATEMGVPLGKAFHITSLFIPGLFGYLAYSSWATLQAYTGNRPRW